MSFIKLSLNDIKNNEFSFSASSYTELDINYSFYKKLYEFVQCVQKGTEPGSKFYSNEDKTYKFIRTSNIEDNSFLFNEKLCIGVLGNVFEEHNLKKWQILLVKDGTLGKVALLDKDYPDCMLCAGIHSLTCDFPYYVFAIIQHPYFKSNFERSVPRGSTISHAGEKYLNFDIPLPIDNDKTVMHFVENLMCSAFFKEILIKEKFNNINDLISHELNFEGFDGLINQEFPKINEILEKNKLYAGYNSKKSKFIRDLIKSYVGGYFFIDEDKLSSGFTPEKNKKRGPVDNRSLMYNWIIPTNINDFGFITDLPSIEFEYRSNNLKNNACLIINRTSKKIDGESGKFVGISTFYDFDIFGEGQHNQGIYRLENYCDTDLIMLTVLLNHPLYRELFGEISLGSKMKEIKIDDLVNIPFPSFDSTFKTKINNLYYSKTEYNAKNLNNENFLEYDKKWCESAGLYDLYLCLEKQKIFLNNIIELIYNGKSVNIDYNFIN